VYSVFAIVFGLALTIALVAMPEMRQLHLLLPASGLGFIINVALMFIVFRDIFARRFPAQRGRLFWVGLLLVCWPAIVVYLPLYGFKPR
jgi:uncharacterized membrane protein YbhN (UPF0104 family)